MASAEFSADSEEKRPTVQIGDPFTEKLLIEACLELMETDAIVAIQDMGAAGLTSSSVEMAGKGGMGIALDLDAVPQRETGMTAYEMMLSESQERMLMVLHPGREAEAERIFRKWELDFAVIGHLTDTGRIVIRHGGTVEADIPLAPLESEAPLYRRPTADTPKQPSLDPATIPDPVGIEAALLKLVACPDLCSRRWIWDQYDSMVGGQTARRPGAADAAVVRIEDHSRALALTTDVTPRYCQADPETGGAQAVAEAWRNITATGARPLADHRQHEFRQPRAPGDHGPVRRLHPRHGRRLHRARLPRRVRQRLPLQRDARPGRRGAGHPPHPRHRRRRRAGGRRHKRWASPFPPASTWCWSAKRGGWLGQSLWLREVAGREDGAPPPVDLSEERRNGDFVRARILEGKVRACHDCSDGGLLVALAEMAMASGTGATLLPAPGGFVRTRLVVRRRPGPLRPGRGRRGGAARSRPRRRRPRPPPRPVRRRGLGSGRRPVHIGSEAAGRPRGHPAGHDGGGVTRMAMQPAEIEALIKAALPDAEVTIEDLAGDGDHYAASVVSESFRGKSRVQQHQIVYAALQGRMGGELHALALQTSAPS